jgi:hypothetical protein
MKKIIFTLIIALVSLGAKAQDVDFTLGADVVSSYIWRGGFGTGAAIQPAAGLSVGGFSLSAWGSVSFEGGDKEVDFTATYEIAGLSIAVTDYWWEGEDALKYFMYKSRSTAHLFEATLEYKLPIEKFPLSLSVNTMFAGADYSKANGDRAYSTYIAASYPFSIKEIALSASVGITPSEGIYASDFSVVNIGLRASKELKITDSFSLPVFGEIITNPRSEDIFFVFGISL